MKVNCLFTWDFLVGIIFGILATITLLFLIYTKSIDNLIQGKERVREKEAVVDKILDYMNDIDMIKDWNKQIIVESEEGK